jgi:hypothetical protein
LRLNRRNYLSLQQIHGGQMNDNDHYAFVRMSEAIECENPFDEGLAWDPDDWEDEENSRFWWV